MVCRWHRLGISVKGNSATALLDCGQQDTKEIARNKAQLSTDGIFLYGQEIDDEAFFDVSETFFLSGTQKKGYYHDFI
jgi:collagen type V/XI/XXIV/XXVII alpha